MNKVLNIALLLVTMIVAGCSRPPESSNPELLQGGPFPNLSSVPARPETMSLAEREQLRRELMGNNKEAQESQTDE